MAVSGCRMALLLLIAGMAVAIAGMAVVKAAPNIPPGEMAGRERERFIPSPVDRFTDPFAWPRQAEPLYRWCDDKAPRRAKRKQSRRDQGC